MTRTPFADVTNYEDIVDPTVNDDETQSFDVGSRWTNTALGKVFFCVDPATGAAVWKDVSTPGAGSQPTLRDEGTPVAGGPHTVYDFVGEQVEVTNQGGGVAKIATSPIVDRLVDFDIVVPTGEVRVGRNICIFDGQELKIEQDAEYLLL